MEKFIFETRTGYFLTIMAISLILEGIVTIFWRGHFINMVTGSLVMAIILTLARKGYRWI